MLSIIVSSYQQEYFTQFSKNVKETIGDDFEYEIIQQWNPGVMGICEAYNKGAEKANYDNLLFIHEDVLFETQDWGEVLTKNLSNITIGCVGVAGSSIKTHFPIAWWDINDGKFLHLNQVINNNKIIKTHLLFTENQVVLLDGVFIAVRKEVWNEEKFNQNLLKKFHGYDIDFSARVSKKYKNYVNNDILITHFSEGKAEEEWFLELIKVYKNINYYIKTPSTPKINELEFIELFFRYTRNFKLSKKDILIIFFKLYNPFFYTIKENYKIFKMLNFYSKK